MWDILIETIEIFIEFGDGFIEFIENKNLNKRPILILWCECKQLEEEKHLTHSIGRHKLYSDSFIPSHTLFVCLVFVIFNFSPFLFI